MNKKQDVTDLAGQLGELYFALLGKGFDSDAAIKIILALIQSCQFDLRLDQSRKPHKKV